MPSFDLESSSPEVKRQECDTWTPERVQELTRLANHEPLLSKSEIGRRLGVTSTTIANQLRQHRIEHRYRRRGEDTWTPERLDHLTQLFEKGLPAAEIARRMGLTKNAIIGKLHRLGEWRPASCDTSWQPYTPPRDVFNGGGCVWPLGHPGEPGFRFCGHHDLKPGKPYCLRHSAIAYRKPEEGQEDV